MYLLEYVCVSVMDVELIMCEMKHAGIHHCKLWMWNHVCVILIIL